MRRILVGLALTFVTCTGLHAEPQTFFDEYPNGAPGGITFIRRGDQRLLSIGGILIPLRVRLAEGDSTYVVRQPSALHSPQTPPFPPIDRWFVEVRVPDPSGEVYLNGQLVPGHGTIRLLQPNSPDAERMLNVRATFRRDGQTITESREAPVRAGQVTTVSFDGSRSGR